MTIFMDFISLSTTSHRLPPEDSIGLLVAGLMTEGKNAHSYSMPRTCDFNLLDGVTIGLFESIQHFISILNIL